MYVQTVYSYYAILWLAMDTTTKVAVGVAAVLIVVFLVLEVISVVRKVRAGRSVTSALIIPPVSSRKSHTLSALKKEYSVKPAFFIPEFAAVHSEDVQKAVSVVAATISVPDGEDILSEMYAEKAATISMLNGLREELVASESSGAIRAIDVLIADIQRRNVSSVWQLGASRIADGTK